MGNVVISVASAWSRFLRGNKHPFISLPDEILVDEIIQWLSVRDIVHLRQVNRALSLVTKRPAIWKRLLKHLASMPQPLAPLPPIKAYNFRVMTSLDLETIVTRAISYEDCWKREVVKPWGQMGGLAFCDVQEMVLLPGGHFLVTSCRISGQHSVVIWTLEHPASQRIAPIIYRLTGVKAYGLQAKYMFVRGTRGICISFLRKYHKIRGDSRFIPETFELGGRPDPEDPYMPLRHECITLHVPLSVIDGLMDRKVRPKTAQFIQCIREASSRLGEEDLFELVSRVRSSTQLGGVSLDMISGSPYVCILKRPSSIIFEQLNTGVRSVLECRPLDFHTRQELWNFRVLPEQGQVLVVRNIERDNTMTNDYLMIELFNLPPEGQIISADSVKQSLLRSRCYFNVQISDTQRTYTLDGDESINPLLVQSRPPAPLSLFCRTLAGFALHSIWPTEVTVRLPPATTPDQSSPSTTGKKKLTKRFIYDLSNFKHYTFGDKKDSPEPEQVLRVLPGTYRAVVYEIPPSYMSTTPPVLNCFGFQLPSTDLTAYLDEDAMELDEVEVERALLGDDAGISHPSLVVPLREARNKCLAPMSIPRDVYLQISQGIRGVCFDEESGRLAFATKRDKRLHFLDFAFARGRDEDDEEMIVLQDKATEAEEFWKRSVAQTHFH